MGKFSGLTSDPTRVPVPPTMPRAFSDPSPEQKEQMREGKTAMKSVGEMFRTRRPRNAQGDGGKTGAAQSVASAPNRTTLLGGGY